MGDSIWCVAGPGRGGHGETLAAWTRQCAMRRRGGRATGALSLRAPSSAAEEHSQPAPGGNPGCKDRRRPALALSAAEGLPGRGWHLDAAAWPVAAAKLRPQATALTGVLFSAPDCLRCPQGVHAGPLHSWHMQGMGTSRPCVSLQETQTCCHRQKRHWLSACVFTFCRRSMKALVRGRAQKGYAVRLESLRTQRNQL